MADFDNLIGRVTLPLRMNLNGTHKVVGTVQVDLDLDSVRINDAGELYALLDLNKNGELDG